MSEMKKRKYNKNMSRRAFCEKCVFVVDLVFLFFSFFSLSCCLSNSQHSLQNHKFSCTEWDDDCQETDGVFNLVAVQGHSEPNVKSLHGVNTVLTQLAEDLELIPGELQRSWRWGEPSHYDGWRSSWQIGVEPALFGFLSRLYVDHNMGVRASVRV